MKERADKVLLESGMVKNIKEAQSLIMQGLFYADDEKVDKPGHNIDNNSDLYIKKGKHDFVSRGGLKLEKAIKLFNIRLEDKVTMDVGSSTGGFTDCMLREGAKKVYAVDVGYGQLAWQLRNDKRVVVMERTNIREVKRSDIKEDLDFITIDVSFISLKLVLPVLKELLKESGEIVALVKPQFEARKSEVGEGGIINDKNIHFKVLKEILEFIDSIDFYVKKLDFSPVTGAKGNIEFLLYFKNKEDINQEKLKDRDILDVIEKSHRSLK